MLFEYKEHCEIASKSQGIDDIVKELDALGIKATSEQTGGFTMCAYIELLNGHYIYANKYGASVYDSDDYFDDVQQFDRPQAPKTIALAVQSYINNLPKREG